MGKWGQILKSEINRTFRIHQQPVRLRRAWLKQCLDVPQNAPNPPPTVGYDGLERQLHLQPRKKKSRDIINQIALSNRL